MSTPAPAPIATAPIPTLAINVQSHPNHWKDILDLIMKLAPIGAAVTANFVPINVAQQINASVELAEQVEPIVIQIVGIKPTNP